MPPGQHRPVAEDDGRAVGVVERPIVEIFGQVQAHLPVPQVFHGAQRAEPRCRLRGSGNDVREGPECRTPVATATLWRNVRRSSAFVAISAPPSLWVVSATLLHRAQAREGRPTRAGPRVPSPGLLLDQPAVHDRGDRRVRRDVVDRDLEQVVARLQDVVPWAKTV